MPIDGRHPLVRLVGYECTELTSRAPLRSSPNVSTSRPRSSTVPVSVSDRPVRSAQTVPPVKRASVGDRSALPSVSGSAVTPSADTSLPISGMMVALIVP